MIEGLGYRCDFVAERLHHKTGVSNLIVIDTILPQARFHEIYDIGTGPLYGNSIQSAGTVAVIEAACKEVSMCAENRVSTF